MMGGKPGDIGTRTDIDDGMPAGDLLVAKFTPDGALS